MKYKPIVTGIFSVVLMLTPPPGGASETPAGYSHASWQTVLQQFVDSEGRVDYRALAADRGQLDRYLALVTEISPESHPQLFPSRGHQLAYYINAYNALVFDGVLDLGPGATTVWGWSTSGYGFFVKRKVVVGGRRTNLRDLENQDIRERFQDPRIHAALNCASIGCPRLPREAFDGETLDEQLDAAMVEFVGDERHCRVDPAKGVVALSKIFDWFKSDFVEHEARQENPGGGLIDYVNRYRGPEDQIDVDLGVEFLPYDKGLNRLQ